YALDYRRELLERISLFVCIGMPVISTFNAGNDVPKHTFRNIRAHAGACHQGLCRSPQVMKGPVRNGLNLRAFLCPILHSPEYGFIELGLALAEPRVRRIGTGGKHVVAIIVLWLRRDYSEGRLRQWDEIRTLRFVPLSRNRPYPVRADFFAAHVGDFIA